MAAQDWLELGRIGSPYGIKGWVHVQSFTDPPERLLKYRVWTLQAAQAGLFDALVAGDVLFVDSSHILMPGSDVDLLLNRVLPRLPSGVLVHIHDIFLPFDYPAVWGWRNYNEQQGVAPLLAGGACTPLFSSVWAERRLADRLARSVVPRLPQRPEAMATSLWLEMR